MRSWVKRTLVSVLLVILLASLVVPRPSGLGPTRAPAPAGTVQVTATSPTVFLAEQPADGSLLGMSDPVTVIAVAYVDPAAPVLAVDFHLDGMNLTSAGAFNDTSFMLPVGFTLRDGPHFANLTLLDTVGLAYHNWTFTVDTIPPILVVTAPAYTIVPVPAVPVEGTAFAALAAASPVTVTVTALPSGLSLSTTANVTSGAFSVLMPLTEGPNALFVNATDAAGNLATQIVSVVRDTIAPPLVVTTPANLSVSPTNLVRFAGASEFGAYLTVGGYLAVVAPNGTWSILLALPDGLNIVPIAASDQVGNTNLTIWAVFVDADVPEVTLTSPTASLTSRSTVTVSGYVNDTQVVEVLVRVNQILRSVSWDASTGFFTTTVTGLPDGVYTIDVVAVDAAQHVTTAHAEVRVDTTPPSVSLSFPPDGFETNASTVKLNGTVDDPSAVVLVDGQMVRPDAGGGWQAMVALLPGENTIVISAVDAAGNSASPILVHVDYASPVPSLQNGTASNAQNLDELGAILRLSLLGIVLLVGGVTLVLHSRVSRRLREDRRVIAELVRRTRGKP